ncbi:unnamed protein product [Pylaiella littoralis]
MSRTATADHRTSFNWVVQLLQPATCSNQVASGEKTRQSTSRLHGRDQRWAEGNLGRHVRGEGEEDRSSVPHTRIQGHTEIPKRGGERSRGSNCRRMLRWHTYAKGGRQLNPHGGALEGKYASFLRPTARYCLHSTPSRAKPGSEARTRRRIWANGGKLLAREERPRGSSRGNDGSETSLLHQNKSHHHRRHLSTSSTSTRGRGAIKGCGREGKIWSRRRGQSNR